MATDEEDKGTALLGSDMDRVSIRFANMQGSRGPFIYTRRFLSLFLSHFSSLPWRVPPHLLIFPWSHVAVTVPCNNLCVLTLLSYEPRDRTKRIPVSL